MPRPGGGDVVGGVEVSVVQSAALATRPLPYSELCSTFRTRRGRCPARRADLGGKRLAYFLVVDACVLALVCQHRLEAVDTGVVVGLGVVALGEQFDGHVADVHYRGSAAAYAYHEYLEILTSNETPSLLTILRVDGKMA